MPLINKFRIQEDTIENIFRPEQCLYDTDTDKIVLPYESFKVGVGRILVFDTLDEAILCINSRKEFIEKESKRYKYHQLD